MSRRLREASMQVTPGSSVVVPLAIEGLPDEIDALGIRWQRKREFHMTAVPAEPLESAIEDKAELWDRVTRTLSGRSVGPITAGGELRRVHHPERPGVLTLIVMVDAPGLEPLYASLARDLGIEIEPPPAHVTLYSTDPAEGIGIANQQQLHERAPELSEAEQQEVRDAMCFSDVLFDDGGIAFADVSERVVHLGESDSRFTPPVMHALAYAAHVHREQRRKGTQIPYLAHLVSVAALVAEDGGEQNELIAALLHDTAEDHGGRERLGDVRLRFGSAVAEAVAALSDSMVAQGEPKEKWRQRKERYLKHLWAERSEGTLRVANADKLHNARAILADLRQVGPAVWSRFGAPREDQLWYYDELVRLFLTRRVNSALARELAETVAQLRRA
jgi:hypothetical protein